jgi:hypothetical protein
MAGSFPIDKVEALAKKLACHSWEFGVVSMALLEVHNPELTVFGNSTHEEMFGRKNGSTNVLGLEYAKLHIQLDATTLVDSEGLASQ